MTIGIGVLLHDRALLIADGKTSNILGAQGVTSSDTNKITIISQHCCLISFGVVIATEIATNLIGRHSNVITDPASARDLIDSSVKRGFIEFAKVVDISGHQNNPMMKAGMIAVGSINQTLFLCAALHGINVNQSPILLTGVQNFIFLGAEEHGAEPMFKTQFLGALEANLDTQTTSALVVLAAQNTIRHVETLDAKYGGTIRYAQIPAAGIVSLMTL